ncbi:hypothetical protein FM107_14210 [Sphingobacterium sp. JB170]|nr:hypothetical protein FM107_14210 [Sphingobacterium sp. JB170]
MSDQDKKLVVNIECKRWVFLLRAGEKGLTKKKLITRRIVSFF